MGSNFGNSQPIVSVSINNLSCPIQSISDLLILCQVGPGVGTGISLIVNAGGLSVSSVLAYQGIETAPCSSGGGGG